MGLHRFLSLLAAFIGLTGAVFLAKGILVLSPKDMLHSTTHYSAMGWPSKEIISSMAIQKADTLIGVTYIFLAFSIQVVSLVLVNGEIPFAVSRWTAVGMAFALASILTIIFYLINGGIRDYNELKVEKLVVRDYCTKRFVGRVADPANVKGLEDMSQEYFNLERNDSETKVDFIKRIAKYVQWTVPDDIDFSKIDEK